MTENFSNVSLGFDNGEDSLSEVELCLPRATQE